MAYIEKLLFFLSCCFVFQLADSVPGPFRMRTCASGCVCMANSPTRMNCARRSLRSWPGKDEEKFPRILTLDLTGNLLDCGPSNFNIREQFPNLRTIILSENPMTCSVIEKMRVHFAGGEILADHCPPRGKQYSQPQFSINLARQ
jgi:hypothetical protein